MKKKKEFEEFWSAHFEGQNTFQSNFSISEMDRHLKN